MTKTLLNLAGTLVGAALMLPAQTLINGAGATFPAPMYTKWFSEYKKLHNDIQFNYQPLGSGAGIKQVTEGTVDFGASDALMTDAQISDFTAKQKTSILALPTVAGAVVPIYNVPGVTGTINFTGPMLADIFLGKITKWNDPAIMKANPSMKLPGNDIVVVHRAEASGTTFCFTDYLAKVSPDWKSKVGAPNAAPNWPTGLGAKGSDGVAGQVKQTANSIGYVELVFAEQNKIGYGAVQNKDGKYVTASLAGITAAAAGAVKTMPEDFRVSIVDSPGGATYPISTFTWLLVPQDIKDPAKKAALKGFLTWMLKDGQNMTEALSYAKLPKEVVAKEEKAIAKIK